MVLSRSSGGVGRSPGACILVPVTMPVDLTCFGSVLASPDKDLASTSKKRYTISGSQISSPKQLLSSQTT